MIGFTPPALKFALVGFGNTVTGLLVIYILKWTGHVTDIAANIGGYSVGLALSFALNRNWTFNHSGSTLVAAGRFAMVFAIAYLSNIFVVITLIEGFRVNTYLA